MGPGHLWCLLTPVLTGITHKRSTCHQCTPPSSLVWLHTLWVRVVMASNCLMATLPCKSSHKAGFCEVSLCWMKSGGSDNAVSASVCQIIDSTGSILINEHLR